MNLLRREFWWALLLMVILVVGLLIASNWHHSILKNDPIAFAERTHQILDGKIPYIDFEFEHLPVALAPMLATGLLEKALGNVHYTLLFWLVMSLVLFGLGNLLNRVGHQLGRDDVALRWVAISWAVLPLAAFRVDPVSVLLTLLALSLLLAGSEKGSAWAMGTAIAAKGWPIVLSVVDWWRGKRARAALTVVITIAGIAVLASFPLFRSGREFFGVHVETATGAVAGLVRSLTGSSLRTGVTAGATYIEVGRWAPALNAGLGIALGLSALRSLRNPFSWERAIDLIGVLTVAVMFVSPLLSAQFVIWITPFAALTASRRVRRGAAAAAVLTGVFVIFWYFDSSWWWGVIVARNAALMWTGWTWSQYVARPVAKTVPAAQM
jgi:hypothetical protein